MYGWSSKYPLSSLTVSQTADRHGINNTPSDPSVLARLSKVSDFVARLPFSFRIGSGYRSPEVNARIGGATKSQHLSGEAVDLTPLDRSNAQAATWLYAHQAEFPELDQIIWYTDSDHLHVSVGGQQRGEFLKGTKEGSLYYPWAPTGVEQVKQAGKFFGRRWVQTTMWTLAIGSVVAVSAIGIAEWQKRTPRSNERY